MRYVLLIATAIVVVLLGLNVFFWSIAQGSGHNIPARTNIVFGVRTVVLAVFAVILITARIKVSSKRNGRY